MSAHACHPSYGDHRVWTCVKCGEVVSDTNPTPCPGRSEVTR